MTASTFVGLALQAIRNPREAASTLLSMGVPREALVPALALVIVVSALVAELAGALAPQTTPDEALPPLAVTVVMGLLVAVYTLGLYRAGRAMGGTGSLAETILIVAFLQFIVLLGQLVEIALWIAAPPLAGLFVVFMLILAFWISLNFVDILHGYGSLLKSLALMLAVSLGMALIFVVLLSLAGVNLQGGA